MSHSSKQLNSRMGSWDPFLVGCSEEQVKQQLASKEERRTALEPVGQLDDTRRGLSASSRSLDHCQGATLSPLRSRKPPVLTTAFWEQCCTASIHSFTQCGWAPACVLGACMCTMCVQLPTETTRGRWAHWNWSLRGLGTARCGCWEPNLGPLKKQQVLLTTDDNIS